MLNALAVEIHGSCNKPWILCEREGPHYRPSHSVPCSKLNQMPKKSSKKQKNCISLFLLVFGTTWQLMLWSFVLRQIHCTCILYVWCIVDVFISISLTYFYFSLWFTCIYANYKSNVCIQVHFSVPCRVYTNLRFTWQS